MRSIFWRNLFCLWALFFVMTPAVAFAAMGDDDDDDDDFQQAAADPEAWKVRREEIKQEIKEEVNDWLQKNFQKKQIVPVLAQQLFVKWKGVEPDWRTLENGYEVPAPRGRAGFNSDKEALEKIREDLREELMDEYHEMHPVPLREDLEQEGRETYPMFHIGDIIPEGDVNLRQGRGTNVRVRGKFTMLNPERLRIGDRWITREDLDEKTEGRFYKAVNDKIVEDYVNDKIKLYHGKEEAWVSRAIDDRLPKRYLEYWYVPKEMRPDWLYSTNPDRWMSRRAFMDRAYDLNRKAVEKRRTEELSKQKFEEAGWIYYAEEEDWFPQEVYEEMLAAAQAPAANPNDPMNQMNMGAAPPPPNYGGGIGGGMAPLPNDIPPPPPPSYGGGIGGGPAMPRR